MPVYYNYILLVVYSHSGLSVDHNCGCHGCSQESLAVVVFADRAGHADIYLFNLVMYI